MNADRTCPRCGVSLGAEEHFCVACGFHDPTRGAQRLGEVELKLHERRAWWQRFLRWFRSHRRLPGEW